MTTGDQLPHEREVQAAVEVTVAVIGGKEVVQGEHLDLVEGCCRIFTDQPFFNMLARFRDAA